MSCGAGDVCGFAFGEPAGVGTSGVWVCGEAAGVGEDSGIFMPGVITCGLGEGFGAVDFLVEVRLARGADLFLGLARLGFGFGFAVDGFGIT